MEIDSVTLEQALEVLGQLLYDRGLQYEVVAIGGGSLLLLGQVDRTTKDLDLVALVKAGELVSADPLPPHLLQAAEEVGNALQLGTGWLNIGPAPLLELGLPEGFVTRMHTRRYHGLIIHLASRIDQICFKLYASVDQGPKSKHFADLKQLQPTLDELQRAKNWSLTHDVSEPFADELHRALAVLGGPMQALSKQFDKHLTDLCWSLWTELGVAGVVRRHQKFLIAPEELILLTSVVGKTDPRLRDEALDWCASNHHLISVSRLKALAKAFSPFVSESFSVFSAILNSVSSAHWPCLEKVSPLKFRPSKKSRSPEFKSPALLSLRLRRLFGVGARADVIEFFLVNKKRDFAISDVAEIGYTKRNIADVLDGFSDTGIFDVQQVRNQKRYSFAKRDQMIKTVGKLPEFTPPWSTLLEILLSLRACIHDHANKSQSTQVVEIRNALLKLQNKLQRLGLSPPPLQADMHAYWCAFSDWILGITRSLAEGKGS